MQNWKPIPGYAGIYEVSNDGAVRRVSDRYGRPICRLCRPSDVRGYKRFVLCVNDIKKTHSAHRLVWTAFVGPIPNSLQINHKNGNRSDNRTSNLELCTASENKLHSFRVLGAKPIKNPNPGSRNGRAKIDEADIPTIRHMYASGLSQQKIADHFGICQTSVSRVLIGKAWTHA